MGVVFSALARGAAESGLTAPESAYIPLRRHPELFGTEMKAEWFEPSFLALVEAARNGSTPARLVADGLLREETAGVYSFAMLRPRFCAMVLEEIEGYQLSGLPIRRPNSMNNCARAQPRAVVVVVVARARASHTHTRTHTPAHTPRLARARARAPQTASS